VSKIKITMPAVLFDLDGVISDSIAYAVRGVRNVCRQSGISEITQEQFVQTFHAPYLEKYRALGVTASREQINEWYQAEAKHEEAPMFSDVIEMLEHLKQHLAVVGMVTAQHKDVAQCICDSYGISQHFKFWAGNAQDKVPAIRQFREDYWYIPDEKFCFVGDFPSDMRDAKRAGVRGIGLTRGHPTRDVLLAAGAEVCIEHLTELPAVTCCREIVAAPPF